MSVAQFSAQELGTFGAILAKQKIMSEPIAYAYIRWLAKKNAEAWNDRYSDTIARVSDEELSKAFAQALRDASLQTETDFGPLGYNISGTPVDARKELAELERRARSWQEASQREQERATENAVAYNDAGQQRVFSAAEIRRRCLEAGKQRVIFAVFGVNESDSQTDYFGGRRVREVVIGFGKGKRENFRQLRKAAASFPPTAHLGLGKKESIEHRETWSMGGGNYLGYSRYAGWKVRSEAVEYISDGEQYELFEPLQR